MEDPKHLPIEIEPGTEPDLNTKGIVYTGVVGGLTVLVTIMALQALYYSQAQREIARKESVKSISVVQDLTNAQLAELQSSRWIDTASGTISIPIDTAMDKVLADAIAGYEGKPAAPAAASIPALPETADAAAEPASQEAVTPPPLESATAEDMAHE